MQTFLKRVESLYSCKWKVMKIDCLSCNKLTFCDQNTQDKLCLWLTKVQQNVFDIKVDI